MTIIALCVIIVVLCVLGACDALAIERLYKQVVALRHEVERLSMAVHKQRKSLHSKE